MRAAVGEHARFALDGDLLTVLVENVIGSADQVIPIRHEEGDNGLTCIGVQDLIRQIERTRLALRGDPQ